MVPANVLTVRCGGDEHPNDGVSRRCQCESLVSQLGACHEAHLKFLSKSRHGWLLWLHRVSLHYSWEDWTSQRPHWKVCVFLSFCCNQALWNCKKLPESLTVGAIFHKCRNVLYILDGIAGVITVQPISKTVGCWWCHVDWMVRGSLGLWFKRTGATRDNWDNTAYVCVNYGLPNPPRGVTRHNCFSAISSKLELRVGEDGRYVLGKSHPLHQPWNATSCAKWL